VTGINLYDFSGRLTSSAGRAARTRQGPAQPRGGYEVSFFASIEAFMNAYVKGEPAETPGAVGLFNMELEAAIARSRRSGAVERLVG
jgi:predicted dehydrogenase